MLTVREITKEDIEPLTDYWDKATPEYLKGMGVDLSKMSTREEAAERIRKQLMQKYEEKSSYCIIWLLDGKPVGHNNVNDIVFGKEAHMHLHMWKPDSRRRGLGPEFIKLALPYFFENLKLKVLYCEPSASNPSPNKALPKAGFEFVKEYMTIPSTICSEQLVNRWQMTYEKYKSIVG